MILGEHALHTPDREHLARLLEDRRVVVCVGSGGVGKTTTAAALGLYGASLGKRTLVITIDPARRLANALGLDALAHAPQPIDGAVLAAAGLRVQAPLSAMMLDLKAAWDDMLVRTAPDEETAARILGNRFYEALSRDLPGAHEFIACEALHHLVESGRWDLVVLDTPPTSNALDFLEAPSRILSVLDSDAFKLFTRGDSTAARLGLRFLDSVGSTAQSVLARFTGAHILEELADFILLWRDLYGPLTQRTRAFEALLRSRSTRFCVVTSPQPSALREASFFLEELSARGLPLGAVVVNRVMPSPFGEADPPDAAATRALLAGIGVDDERLASALATAAAEQVHDARADALAAEQLVRGIEEKLGRERAGSDGARVPVVLVPRLQGDVHDARRLVELLPWLVGPDVGPPG